MSSQGAGALRVHTAVAFSGQIQPAVGPLNAELLRNE